jgi:hypothetical protein
MPKMKTNARSVAFRRRALKLKKCFNYATEFYARANASRLKAKLQTYLFAESGGQYAAIYKRTTIGGLFFHGDRAG